MTWLFNGLLILLVVLSILMILLILIQRGRGGGLVGAFGGGGGTQAFGSKTGDVLTWVTAIVFGVFVALSIGLVYLGNHIHSNRTDANTAQAQQQTDAPRSSNPLKTNTGASDAKDDATPASTQPQ